MTHGATYSEWKMGMKRRRLRADLSARGLSIKVRRHLLEGTQAGVRAALLSLLDTLESGVVPTAVAQAKAAMHVEPASLLQLAYNQFLALKKPFVARRLIRQLLMAQANPNVVDEAARNVTLPLLLRMILEHPLDVDLLKHTLRAGHSLSPFVSHSRISGRGPTTRFGISYFHVIAYAGTQNLGPPSPNSELQKDNESAAEYPRESSCQPTACRQYAEAMIKLLRSDTPHGHLAAGASLAVVGPGVWPTKAAFLAHTFVAHSMRHKGEQLTKNRRPYSNVRLLFQELAISIIELFTDEQLRRRTRLTPGPESQTISELSNESKSTPYAQIHRAGPVKKQHERLLLADADMQSPSEGWTPLHILAMQGNSVIITYLSRVVTHWQGGQSHLHVRYIMMLGSVLRVSIVLS